MKKGIHNEILAWSDDSKNPLFSSSSGARTRTTILFKNEDNNRSPEGVKSIFRDRCRVNVRVERLERVYWECFQVSVSLGPIS